MRWTDRSVEGEVLCVVNGRRDGYLPVEPGAAILAARASANPALSK